LTSTELIVWEALDGFPQPITMAPMAGGGSTAINLVVSFILFDASNGRAGYSGIATSLEDASGARRVQAAFARGHVHEFTHAFSRVRDEYIEYDRTTNSTSETSNVVATNVCAELPWQHLLVGGSINPDVDQLVGAFGVATYGFHPELKCLMNGTHDNATVYGGNGLLRTDDRLCNYCRELTAFRVLERTSRLVGYDPWKASYRNAFFASEGFSVPSPIPQTNSDGQTFFNACVP
jgi:hypothetical protein